MVLICGPLSLIVVPSLLSLNLIGARGNLDGVGGMDQLSWSSVTTVDTTRLWGHFVCTICIVFYSCFTITSELNFYLREILHKHVSLPSSKSHLVLLTDIPVGMRDRDELDRFFEKIPACIEHIEILRDDNTLSASISRRRAVHRDLERAETRLIQKAHANRERGAVERVISDRGDMTGTTSQSLVYVSDGDREKVRLPRYPWMAWIPFLGRRGDKIVQRRRELAMLNRGIEQEQRNFQSFRPQPSAILQFSSKFLALAVADPIIHPFPNCMQTYYLGTSTEDIIWSNLGSTWWERQLRSMLVFILSLGLVLGWTVPIAFTGVLSQLSYLVELVPWLSWVSDLPVWSVALLQGVLPQIALSILLLIFPDILRMVVNQKRLFTKTDVELTLQKYYFAFLFIHLFLTVSISSGMVTVLAELLNSMKFGPVILARNLPKASNYFLSYILLQAFYVSGSTFIQLAGILRFTFNKFTATTPREHATKSYNLSVIQWGTFFPIYTNLGCIGRSLYFLRRSLPF
jgi:hypothetical protein